MDLKKRRMQIEAIKLAIEALPKDEISIEETIESSIFWLWYYYICTGNKECLSRAILQMAASLELGVWNEPEGEIFDRIFELSGVDKTAFLSKYGQSGKKLRLTKNRIRTIIGRWRRGNPEDMKLDEVVDDIYDRMQRNESGTKCYISHQRDGGIFGMYELIISEKEHILHDVVKKKYYSFEVRVNDEGRTD